MTCRTVLNTRNKI